MTLQEIYSSIAEIRSEWPGGINFKNKSKFVGFSCDELGGQPRATLSLEQIESDRWGATFQPMDKETIAAIQGLFNHFDAKPSVDAVQEKGFDHPCRETCSGWRQGYERGAYEAREELRMLRRICAMYSTASKNKKTNSITQFFGKWFKDKD